MKVVPSFTKVNHTVGHNRTVRGIVIHVMEGNMAGTLSWFRNPDAKVSAHYGVSRSGEVVQYVKEADVAWHAGLVKDATAPLVLELGGNPNDYTVGIEFEGTGHDRPTLAQIASGAELVRAVAARHKVPLDRKHVIGHREIRGDKTCPGLIDVDELLLYAKGRSGRPQPGDRRWSPTLGEHVVLTRYEGDHEWYYVRESELRGMGRRAGAFWSAMPTARV